MLGSSKLSIHSRTDVKGAAPRATRRR